MERNLLARVLGGVIRGNMDGISVLPEQWEALLKLAKRHKVANTLACAIPLLPEESRPDPERARQLEGILFQQTVISSNQLFAAQELQQAFEEKGLYSLALKGVHTKLRYPQDNMRSMGDLDILYKSEQTPQVKQAMEALGYGNFREGRKHDHYSRAPYVEVEMHRQMVSVSSRFDRYCRDFWEHCHNLPGCKFAFAMPIEDEYVYTFIHMVEHFMQGGVGLRFILDVYVYETRVEMDRELLRQKLEQLGLLDFYHNIVKLAQYWFEQQDNEPDALTLELADFVLSGGVYGKAEVASSLAVTKEGRLGFLLRACFPGYREMCSMFPWLVKLPVLLPVAWVIRAVRSLFFRKRNVKSQFQIYAHGDVERGEQVRKFYRDCGLDA